MRKKQEQQPEPITEQERARRQKAVDYGVGSVRLEGLIVDDVTMALNARYVAGEISSEELTKAILKNAGL